MNRACSILVLAGVLLVSPRMAQAQMPVAAPVTVQYAPTTTYSVVVGTGG